MRFVYTIGRKVYHADRIRVREFIEILAAGSELARSDKDPRRMCMAWEKIAASLERISTPKPKLDDVPLSSLMRLVTELWEWSLGDDKDKKQSTDKGGAAARRVSYDELLVPVFKVGMLLRLPVSELLDMEVPEFNRMQRVLDAAWADVRLDLAEVIVMPHLTDAGMKSTRRALEDMKRCLRPDDASPWREHIAQYEERLKAKG